MSWVRCLADVEQELALLEDEGERGELWRSAQSSVGRTWPGFVLTILVELAILLAAVLMAIRLARWLGWNFRLGEEFLFILAPLLLLAGMFSGLFWFRARRRAYQTEVRRQLLARGIPVCLNCGYSLRGQTEPRCSECGAAIQAPADRSTSSRGITK